MVNDFAGYSGLRDVEISISSGHPNDEKNIEDDVHDDDREDEDSEDEQNDESKQMSNNFMSKGVQNKGFIDVWWLFDDGGKYL